MDLGMWTSYLDVPEMTGWYSLPESMQAELNEYRPDGTELDAWTASRFAKYRREIIAYADASVAVLPYHGPRHFHDVEKRGMAAVRMIERLRGRPEPAAVKQAMAIALRMHDCHHGGNTFRADTRPELLYRPEIGTNVTTEWVSALAVNELSLRHGVGLPARLFQVMVVWSSTFGGHTTRGQELGVPEVSPQGLWGRIMRAADVCPPDDFLEWMAGAIAVNYQETPATPPPSTWDGFLRAQMKFSEYVGRCFDRLDAVAEVPVTGELGWRANLTRLRSDLEGVIDGKRTELSRDVRAILAARRIQLDG